MIVAIDGPAGAGKSTVARHLAERLSFRYVDTGAMYRALTWLALERGVDPEDEGGLSALAEANDVELDESGRVAIAGRVVSEQIRSARIDRTVSLVARHPGVREILRDWQRRLAEGDAVIEGRDIGTVVVPGAGVKVYLIASPEVRARRRLAERPEIGSDALSTDLRMRDESDAARMRPAADAEVIDTTELGVDAVVDRIERLVRSRLPA